jgi:hypothetical protein
LDAHDDCQENRMTTRNFTIIDAGCPSTVPVTIDGDSVRLSEPALRGALGLELKPEGLCKGAACFPVRDRAALANATTGVDLAACAAVLDRPIALDIETGAAYLGVSAAERGARLATLEAPDFTLPDVDGTPHTLSGYRGRKILLIAHASW